MTQISSGRAAPSLPVDLETARPASLPAKGRKRRRRSKSVLGVVLGLALVAGTGVVVWSGGGGNSPGDGLVMGLGPGASAGGLSEVPTERRRMIVDLGEATKHAAKVMVGGVVQDLSAEPAAGTSGHPWADIDIARNTGGLAVILNRSGGPLATVPVWSLPGLTPQSFVADCGAASIGQTLLTPWTARPDALSVSFFDTLARSGPTSVVLLDHAERLCARIAGNPDAGGTPPPAELRSQARLICALDGRMAEIRAAIDSGERPAASGDITACPKPRGGALKLDAATRTSITTREPDRESCDLPMWRFDAADPSGTSPFTVCSDGVTNRVVNRSPAVAFFYENGKSPASPLGAVPGEVVTVPNLEKIVLAVLADIGRLVVSGVKAVGCTVLGWFGISFAPCRNPDELTESAVAELFEIIRPGGGEFRGSPRYYSVAWGDESGVPAGLDISRPRAYSRTLTFLNYAVLPVVGMVLNRDVVLDLSSIDSPEKQALLDRLTGQVATPAPGQGDDLGFVVDVAGTILSDPKLLADLVAVFLPSLVSKAPDAIDWLQRTMGYVRKLPVLGYIDAAFMVAGIAANTLEVVISLVRLRQAGSYPAYVSWPSRMTGREASALPAGTCTPLAPDAAPPVYAPGPPACLLPVDADLDGDRVPDRLVLWNASGGPVGGAAYLSDGRIRAWAPGSPSLPGAGGMSAAVTRLDDSPRQEVSVDIGGSAMLVGLTRTGALQAVRYGNGHNQDRLFRIPPATGEHHTGCVSDGSKRLLMTTISHPAQPSGVRTASFYYALDPGDLTLRVVNYSGGYTARPGPFQGADCAREQVPLVRLPIAMAYDSGGPYHHELQAAHAVEMLVDAAYAGDATQASALLGGVTPVPAFGAYTLGVWTLLHDQRPALAQASETPAACARRIPRSGRPFLYCVIGNAGEAWDFQVASTGDNYVVVAVSRRTWGHPA
ncbi:hypothetical protein Aph01nite_11060 [Acrocarpospora phusangensis]|uniref:Uncharacterized protein n=1 Tax=Acrocarpospora phusangensis TaxID=1070424 RepID=A0A919Q612_9ACTN|nr:hypothetical protein [Acrocarpospora phusangensis]GIH22796.1 hypothetical protein Aph01nite_11060 [Acrocarpospora phusangensis]